MKNRPRKTKTDDSDVPVLTPGDGETTAERVSFPIKDGKIDFDGMRPSHAAKIRGLMGHADPSPASTSDTPNLSPLLGKALGQIIGGGITIACVRLTGAPLAVVKPIATLTEEEEAQLVPALSAVLDKYLPTIMGEYGIEAAAILGTYAIFTSKLQQVQAAIKISATVIPIREVVAETPVAVTE